MRNVTLEILYAAEIIMRLALVIALGCAAFYTGNAYTPALAGLMLVGLVARSITLWAWFNRGDDNAA